MWIYAGAGSAAYNSEHISRLYVEETGAGAALKADISGKVTMIAYYESKADAQAALADVMERHEAGGRVVRL